MLQEFHAVFPAFSGSISLLLKGELKGEGLHEKELLASKSNWSAIP